VEFGGRLAGLFTEVNAVHQNRERRLIEAP
jgi:hypothetical protein